MITRDGTARSVQAVGYGGADCKIGLRFPGGVGGVLRIQTDSFLIGMGAHSPGPKRLGRQVDH
jgi:hypothetical protein